MWVRVPVLAAVSLVLALGCGGAVENLRSDEAAAERRGRVELRRAVAAEKRGDNEEAKQHYRSALNLRPEHYGTHRRAALFFRGLGEGDIALEISGGYSERSPGDPRGYHLLADIQFASGEVQQAIDTLSELLSIDDEDAEGYHRRGTLFMDRGKVDRALEDFRSAAKLAPKKSAYLTSLGFALSRNSSKQSLGEAEEVLRKALALKKRNGDANRLLGTVLRKRFEPKAALEFHVRAVELDPDSASAYFELGITQNALGQNEEAEASLKEALELDPKDSVTWYAYGEVLRITKQCSRSIPAYKRALEIDKKHPKAANKLGVCLFTVGQYKQAELILIVAVQTNSDDAYPYFNLGMVYEKLDRPNAAIKSLSRFVELAPSGDGDIPIAKKAILRLQRKIRNRY